MQVEALLDHSKFVRDLAASLTFANEDPDDVVQETWLAAVRHPPEDGPGVRGWLATVMRNALRQSRRSGGRRVAREALAGASRAVPTPDEIREREAVRREVVEAVLDLDEPYRTAVLLRYYEELPPRKIAERTGDPVETVKTRLVRARGMLRKRLDDRRDGDGRSWGFAVAGLALWPGEGRTLAPGPVGTLPWAKVAVVLVAAAVVGVIGVTVSSSPPKETGPDRASAVTDPDDPATVRETGEDPPADRDEGEAGNDAGTPGGRGAAPAAGAGAAIEGTVHDRKTGKPLPDAPVRLVVLGRPTEFRDVRSDGTGAYRFGEVPDGVKVRVFVPGRGRLVRTWAPVSDRVLKRGETARWDLEARVREGIDLRVRVRVPEGAAVPGEIRMTRTSRDGSNRKKDDDEMEVDPETGILTVFLPRGTHSLVFQAPGLAGELGPIVVEGDGPPRGIMLDLRRVAGLRLRLVDEAGKPWKGGAVRIGICARLEYGDPTGRRGVMWESMGSYDSDDRGELDLGPILPPLAEGAGVRTTYCFVVTAEGIYQGNGTIPNWEIGQEELLRRRRDLSDGDVVLDLPALPHKTIRTKVVTASGKPVAGVRVVGEPAEYFVDEEFTSDAAGRLSFRLRTMMLNRVTGSTKPGRFHLVAKPPWSGEISIGTLGMPGGSRGLVVSRVRALRLRFVDDTGAALAGVDVQLGTAFHTTDADGGVALELPEHLEKLKVRLEGHLQEELRLDELPDEAVVHLNRAREVVVSFRGPDGDGIVPVIAREKGSGRFFPVVKTDAMAKTLTLLLPLRTITISVHPTNTRYAGSVVAEPDVREVVLEYRAP